VKKKKKKCTYSLQNSKFNGTKKSQKMHHQRKLMKRSQEITIPSSLKSLKPSGIRQGREVYLDNPFLESFSINMRKKNVSIMTGNKVLEGAEGETLKVNAISVSREIDTSQYIKIYTAYMTPLFELSKAAQKVIQLILLEVQENAQGVAHVFFNINVAHRRCEQLGWNKIAKKTYMVGIKELIDKQFLAGHADGTGMWWFNPAIVFNGDRAVFVQQYVIKRKTEKRDDQYELM